MNKINYALLTALFAVVFTVAHTMDTTTDQSSISNNFGFPTLNINNQLTGNHNPTAPIETQTHYGLFRKKNVNCDPLAPALVDQVLETYEDATQEEIQDIIESLQDPDFCTGEGFKRSFIFVGPPGNGKTTLAQAIAQKAQVAYIFENAKFILTSYINSGSKYLDDLVAYISTQDKIFVVIIDEAHFLLNDSQDQQERSKNADIFSCLFDSAERTKKIVVICTVNSLDTFSLPTCDRLSFSTVTIPALTLNQRIDILRYHLQQSGFNEVSEEYINNFARSQTHISGRQIKNFVTEAKRHLKRLDRTPSNIQNKQETALEKAKAQLYKIKWLYTENPTAHYWRIGTAIVLGIPTLLVIGKGIVDLVRHFDNQKLQDRALDIQAQAQRFQQSLQSKKFEFEKALELAKQALQERTQNDQDVLAIGALVLQDKSLEIKKEIANINANNASKTAFIQALGAGVSLVLAKAIHIYSTKEVVKDAVKQAMQNPEITKAIIQNSTTQAATKVVPLATNILTQATTTPAINMAMQVVAPELATASINAAPLIAEAAVETGMSLSGAVATGAAGGATVATTTATTACALIAAPAAPILMPIATGIVIGGAIGAGVYYFYKK